MNTREYIESGILEAYALGALTEHERAQVEADVAMYPELKTVLLSIEEVMQQYCVRLAIEPPIGTREQIWGSMPQAGNNAGGAQQQPKTIPFRPESRKALDWRYAAMLAVLVGSLAVNYLLYDQSREQKERVVAMLAQMSKLESDQRLLAKEVENYRKSKDMMADNDMQTIVMHTVVKGHPMAATVYWSKAKGDAYVAMNALPEPPKGMQYQMWVIQGGKPVSMGTLPNDMANSSSMQKVPMQVMEGEAFAISLEKEGGNPTPTTVYVVGKV